MIAHDLVRASHQSQDRHGNRRVGDAYNAGFSMRRRIRCELASLMISQRAIKRIVKLWDLSFDAAARLHCETTTSR